MRCAESLYVHLQCIFGHHPLQAIINATPSPWWQVRLIVDCTPLWHVSHAWIILILTYAYGDVCWPLIVVLAGDCSLSNQLEAKLALESEDSAVGKAVPFSYSVERSSRVATTLFVYFYKDRVSKDDISICVHLKTRQMADGIVTLDSVENCHNCHHLLLRPNGSSTVGAFSNSDDFLRLLTLLLLLQDLSR